MIFNPLFIDSDNGQLNLPSVKKSSGSHLFQDIIKLQDKMLDSREFNSSSILPSLLSEVKKMKTVGEYNVKTATSNLLSSNQSTSSGLNSLNNLSEEDIHSLLEKVFSDMELQANQPGTSEDLLANLNTEDLVSKIEQKLMDQGDVKCLISNVDDNTNLLLTIQKAQTSDSANSENGMILTKTDEGEGTEEHYVLNVLELGQDDDANADNMINTSFAGSSLILQLLNQQVNQNATNLSKGESNVFSSDTLNYPGISDGTAQTSSTANQNASQINNFNTELAEAEGLSVKANTVEMKSVLPSSIVNEEGKLVTYPEMENTGTQKLQDPSSTLRFIPTGMNNNTDSANTAESPVKNNPDFDFMVKVSNKTSDGELLANMNFRSGANVSSENQFQMTDADIASKVEAANAGTIKVSMEESSKNASSADNMLKHFPDAKESDNKNININNSGDGNHQAKAASNSNNSSNTFAQGESGQGDSSSSNSNGSSKESKTHNVFKIEEQGNNILQNSTQTQAVSGRVVKVDPQNLTQPHLANEVSDEISDMVISKGKDKATLVLEPQQLGKIKISVEVNDNHVHAKVEVENNTVKEMLQNNSETLKQNLNNSGLQLGSLNISLQQNMAKGSNQASNKQSKRSEKVAELKDDGSNISAAAGRNKSMGYNTYEYII